MKDQTHDVSPEDGEKMLELLRACAHAPPATEEGLEVDHHYKSAEALLKTMRLSSCQILADQHMAEHYCIHYITL